MKKHPSHRLARTASACALLAAIVSVSPDARSDEVSAAEHAKKARVAYDLQEWSKAVAEYRAAYQVEQKPGYLWALAQAQRMAGDFESAIASYKAFKRLDVKTSQANAAEMQITKCEALLAKQQAEAAIKAQHEKEQSRASKPEPAPPTSSDPASKAAKPASPPPAPEPQHWYSDTFGHVLFFGGLVVAGAGGYFLFTGNSDVGDTSGSYDDFSNRRDSGRKKQVIGAGGLVVGGALMAGGVVRYLVVGNGSEAPEADHGPRVGFALLPDRAAVSVAGSF